MASGLDRSIKAEGALLLSARASRRSPLRSGEERRGCRLLRTPCPVLCVLIEMHAPPRLINHDVPHIHRIIRTGRRQPAGCGVERHNSRPLPSCVHHQQEGFERTERTTDNRRQQASSTTRRHAAWPAAASAAAAEAGRQGGATSGRAVASTRSASSGSRWTRPSVSVHQIGRRRGFCVV